MELFSYLSVYVQIPARKDTSLTAQKTLFIMPLSTINTVVEIPGFLHHSNLAVFPANSNQNSHVYLYGLSAMAPVELNQKVQVEYLKDHIYALLPSYQPDLGTVCFMNECPDFLQGFKFGLDLGTIPIPNKHSESKPKTSKVPKQEDQTMRDVGLNHMIAEKKYNDLINREEKKMQEEETQGEVKFKQAKKKEEAR